MARGHVKFEGSAMGRGSQSAKTFLQFVQTHGFLWQSSSIYGGLLGCFDFGPYGTELKRNITREWWRDMVYRKERTSPMDTSILAHGTLPTLATYAEIVDVILANKHLPREKLKEMVVAESRKHQVALRTEASANFLANFNNFVHQQKVPFGMAQAGKVYRQYDHPQLGESKEADTLELAYFINRPGADSSNGAAVEQDAWAGQRLSWWRQYASRPDLWTALSGPLHQGNVNINVDTAWGVVPVETIEYRKDRDLQAFKAITGHAFECLDDSGTNRIMPHMLRLCTELQKAVLVLLADAYHEDGEHVVLRLHPALSPVKAAVWTRSGDEEVTEQFASELRSCGAMTRHLRAPNPSDEALFSAQDTIGTPYCFIVEKDGRIFMRERGASDIVGISSREAAILITQTCRL